MAEVVFKGLKKVYDGVITAVEDLNLTIADREFVVLVGPSGCGKSTTLRMVAGLEDITEGELYIDGVICNAMKPKERDIAMVFQNYALYGHMTVYENMAFPLKLQKMDKKAIDMKVREVADKLELSDVLKRKPKHLSGGQRQRVAIGRAMVRDPKVFLMDEPLSNVDQQFKSQMRGEIVRLRQAMDATFIYVTHDQTDAMTLGDRLVVMQKGHVQQIGTPTEVYQRPVNTFVAGFIGLPAMNLFEGGRLELENGEYNVYLGAARFQLSDFQRKALAANGQKPCAVTVGVRPQEVVIGQGSLEARVELTEMLGSEVNIHVRYGDRSMFLVAPMADIHVNPIPGELLRFDAAPGAVQLFDAETGHNLIWYDAASDEAHEPVCRKYDF